MDRPTAGGARTGPQPSRDVWFYPRRIARPAPPTAYTPSQAVDLVAHPPATDLVPDRRVLRPPRQHLQPVPPPPPEPAAEHAPPAASPARPDAARLRREVPAVSWWRRLLARLHRPHHRPRHRARRL